MSMSSLRAVIAAVGIVIAVIVVTGESVAKHLLAEHVSSSKKDGQGVVCMDGKRVGLDSCVFYTSAGTEMVRCSIRMDSPITVKGE